MKVIVCGGRNFTDCKAVSNFLDRFEYNEGCIDIVIEGGAPGVDGYAHDWARNHGKEVHTFNANWRDFGRSAGPMRNAEMLKQNPDFVIAFPGGRGTENMVKQAKEAGVTVFRAPSDQPWMMVED